jgi:hypothetical protein
MGRGGGGANISCPYAGNWSRDSKRCFPFLSLILELGKYTRSKVMDLGS